MKPATKFISNKLEEFQNISGKGGTYISIKVKYFKRCLIIYAKLADTF